MGQERKQWKMDDYVEVAARVVAWYEMYPEGRIESEIVSMTEKLVVTKSRVYRTGDCSERPAGEGHSMLAIPGKTNFTKDSELENCETSSVGRALVMAGVPAKHIASDNEIRSKTRDDSEPPPRKELPPGLRPGSELPENPVIAAMNKIKQAADYAACYEMTSKAAAYVDEKRKHADPSPWKHVGTVQGLFLVAGKRLIELAGTLEDLHAAEVIVAARIHPTALERMTVDSNERADEITARIAQGAT